MGDLRILMYHAIGESHEPATRFVLPLATFKRQMRLLALLRIRVVRLEEAVRALVSGEALPPRPVALTFDDGTKDNLTLARPVLERHGFPATAFVVTRAMGSTVTWTDHRGLAGRQTLSWPEALELEPLVSLQPHTRSHPSLRSLDDAALATELTGSREDLAQRTGRVSALFAYPYGHYDERVAAAVAEAGFTAACTVRPGLNDTATPPHELRRYEIRGDESLARFLRILLASR